MVRWLVLAGCLVACEVDEPGVALDAAWGDAAASDARADGAVGPMDAGPPPDGAATDGVAPAPDRALDAQRPRDFGPAGFDAVVLVLPDAEPADSDPPDAALPDAQPAPIVPDLALGAFKFQVECAHCHGDDAKGAAWGPQLLGLRPDYAAHILRVGRDAMDQFDDPMPPYIDRLTPLEIESIAAWLASAPKPAGGGSLFEQYCRNCHGLRLGPIEAETFDACLEKVRSGNRTDAPEAEAEYMPAWDAEALTDDEVRAVFEWARAE